MKAITLTQPWATLVAMGAKQWETRSWGTTYRGPLVIHAAKGFPVEAKEWCDDPRSPAFRVLLEHIQRGGPQVKPIWMYLPLGAVIATAELVGCWQSGQAGLLDDPLATLSEQELEFGDFTTGRYGWHLRNVRWLPTPIAARGSLGLWDVPPDLQVAIEGQLATV